MPQQSCGLWAKRRAHHETIKMSLTPSMVHTAPAKHTKHVVSKSSSGFSSIFES
jgi:hypothetical protein